MTPRSYPPASGWSSDGHRIKHTLDYSRGVEKVWVYGALRVWDGQALTLTASSRNTAGYVRLLDAKAKDNPTGDVLIITDSLSSHKSRPVHEWMAANARVHHIFIPVGASWLNLQEGWWRLLRCDTFAGQRFVDGQESVKRWREQQDI